VNGSRHHHRTIPFLEWQLVLESFSSSTPFMFWTESFGKRDFSHYKASAVVVPAAVFLLREGSCGELELLEERGDATANIL
jgi:hypothetical protein